MARGKKKKSKQKVSMSRKKSTEILHTKTQIIEQGLGRNVAMMDVRRKGTGYPFF